MLLFVSYQVHRHSYYCSDELEFNQLSPVSHYIDEGGSATATIQQNVSFTELMETPKIKKKGVCRKKSLNYKAQLVTKSFFTAPKKLLSKNKAKMFGKKNKNKSGTKEEKEYANDHQQCFMVLRCLWQRHCIEYAAVPSV